MQKFLLLLLLCCGFSQIALANPPEIGIATFYGDNFHGRQTTSKEVYDKNELTAAHRTLAYGTIIRVTVLSTGASVDVRINDRGPFVKGRIVILSRKAAETLGIIKEADPQVKIEIVKRADEAAPAPAVSDATPAPAPAPVAATTSTPPSVKTETPVVGDLKPRGKVDAAKIDAAKADAAKKATDPVAPKTDAKKTATAAVEPKKADVKPADNKTAAKPNDAGKTSPKVSPAPAPVVEEPAKNEPIVASRSLKSAATNPNGNKANEGKNTAAPAANNPATANNNNAPKAAPTNSNLYKVQVMKVEEKGFGVQLGGFSDYNVVLQQLEDLQDKDIKGGMVYNDVLNGKPFYKLIVGPFFTKEEAQDYCNKTMRGKHKMKDAFVVDIEALAKKHNNAPAAPGIHTPAAAPKGK